MKTEYWYTDFPEITDTIRKSARIRGRARGVNLIPLAIGEEPPGTLYVAEGDSEIGIEDVAGQEVEIEVSYQPEEKRGILARWSGDERQGE